MGINKTPDELGHQPPPNGYDDFYGANMWSDHLVNKRPKNVSAKRFVVFLSLDLLTLFTLMGIIDRLTTTKEIIVLCVAVLYVIVRLAIGIAKFFAFVGRNRDGIKKGLRTIKELFHE